MGNLENEIKQLNFKELEATMKAIIQVAKDVILEIENDEPNEEHIGDLAIDVIDDLQRNVETIFKAAVCHNHG